MIRMVGPFCLFLALALPGFPGQALAAPESAPAAGPKEVPLSGKVVETMDGGGYTYLLLANGSEKNWIAVPLMKVRVGEQLTLIPGYEMKNFTSRGLNRKFDKIMFSAGVIAADKVALSPSALKMLHQQGPAKEQAARVQAARAENQAPAKSAAVIGRAPGKREKVARAKGPNAYTVAELYAKRGRLEKKTVVVRGRVVKVAAHIMKRNWIHLQDGSGSAKKKNDDIVVTSTQLPNEGDLVTVRGTCFNNIDYGSGYKYKLIVLDAGIKK